MAQHKRSTVVSTGSVWTWGTATVSGTGSASRVKFQGQGKDDPQETLDNIIYQLQLENYSLLSEEERQERLENIDPLDLFYAVEELNKELANVRVENFILTDFLEKNDPRLLVGLSERREVGHSIGTATEMTGARQSLSAPSMNRSTVTTQSGFMDRRKLEYRLNYRTKCEMAEKMSAEMERRIREMEIREMHNIKLLNAEIEELALLYDETLECVRNFKLHFLQDEADVRFLEHATEKNLEQNFRKFVNNWLKNARALLSTMRLKSTTLVEQCQQLRAELISKSDLSGILSAIDFQQLLIKRNNLVNMLEEKNTDMAGLKGVTGKASMAMAKEKQIMMAIEKETQSIMQKTADVKKSNAKLEKEISIVEQGNFRDKEILNNLKEKQQQYEAPSVNDYIERKDELHRLEKEEKMLNRKISILNLKFSSLVKRCRK